MVVAARAVQVCPFYATKDLAEDADIVFMPYNYVTQELSSTPGLVHNTILILDEAHNVEAVCQDTASFDLTAGTRSFPLSLRETKPPYDSKLFHVCEMRGEGAPGS